MKTLPIFLLDTETAATTTSLFDNIVSMLEGIATSLASVVVPLAIVALIACGLWYIVASRNSQSAVMDKLKTVAIGCLIALGASSIVSWLASLANF